MKISKPKTNFQNFQLLSEKEILSAHRAAREANQILLRIDNIENLPRNHRFRNLTYNDLKEISDFLEEIDCLDSDIWVGAPRENHRKFYKKMGKLIKKLNISSGYLFDSVPKNIIKFFCYWAGKLNLEFWTF